MFAGDPAVIPSGEPDRESYKEISDRICDIDSSRCMRFGHDVHDFAIAWEIVQRWLGVGRHLRGCRQSVVFEIAGGDRLHFHFLSAVCVLSIPLSKKERVLS